jgi:hypothetical protein
MQYVVGNLTSLMMVMGTIATTARITTLPQGITTQARKETRHHGCILPVLHYGKTHQDRMSEEAYL